MFCTRKKEDLLQRIGALATMSNEGSLQVDFIHIASMLNEPNEIPPQWGSSGRNCPINSMLQLYYGLNELTGLLLNGLVT